MIKHTTWRPDTCGCEVTLEWDSDADLETRMHTPVRVLPCPAHDDGSPTEEVVVQPAMRVRNADRKSVDLPAVIARTITDRRHAERVGGGVLAENQRKNRAHAAVLEVSGMFDEVDQDGQKVRVLKKGLAFEYVFDAARNLSVDIKGASAADKAKVRAALPADLKQRVAVRG